MKVIFSDLDGTLLHSYTYTWQPARPALTALRERQIPLVFCTSKTRAEVELWRREMSREDPFIVENGGAIYIPQGYFSFPPPGARARDGYDVIELGMPCEELVQVLRDCARESSCEVVGFHDMSPQQLKARCGLSLRQATLAKQREFDEPFEILGTGTYRLLEAIERRGRRWTRGDRFYHITGHHGKAQAVRLLAELFRQEYGQVTTVGVGDGHNDVDFLNAVDIPVMVRSPYSAVLKRSVPRGTVTQSPGPHGWNEGVLQVIAAA